MSGAVAQVTPTLRAEYASVLEFVDGRERLAVGASAGWRAGTVGGVIIGTGYALQSGEPVVIEDLLAEQRFQASSVLLEHGVVSGVLVALRGPDLPFGVLSVFTAQA